MNLKELLYKLFNPQLLYSNHSHIGITFKLLLDNKSLVSISQQQLKYPQDNQSQKGNL